MIPAIEMVPVGQMEDDMGTNEEHASTPCTSSSSTNADPTPNWSERPRYANRTCSKTTIPGGLGGQFGEGWFAVWSEKSEDWWSSSPNTWSADQREPCARHTRRRTTATTARSASADVPGAAAVDAADTESLYGPRSTASWYRGWTARNHAVFGISQSQSWRYERHKSKHEWSFRSPWCARSWSRSCRSGRYVNDPSRQPGESQLITVFGFRFSGAVC
jgi:hypothetical protein